MGVQGGGESSEQPKKRRRRRRQGGSTIPAAWGAPTKRAPRLGAAEGLGWSGEGRERRMSEAAPATGWERRAASMAANGVRAVFLRFTRSILRFYFLKGTVVFLGLPSGK